MVVSGSRQNKACMQRDIFEKTASENAQHRKGSVVGAILRFSKQKKINRDCGASQLNGRFVKVPHCANQTQDLPEDNPACM